MPYVVLTMSPSRLKEKAAAPKHIDGDLMMPGDEEEVRPPVRPKKQKVTKSKGEGKLPQSLMNSGVSC